MEGRKRQGRTPSKSLSRGCGQSLGMTPFELCAALATEWVLCDPVLKQLSPAASAWVGPVDIAWLSCQLGCAFIALALSCPA